METKSLIPESIRIRKELKDANIPYEIKGSKIIIRRGKRTEVLEVNDEESATQQQFAEQCDINNIMKKYQNTGEITHFAKSVGRYIDVSDLGDYRQNLHKVLEAEEAFMDLPSSVRAKFENDPQKMIDFLSDPKNNKEAIELGLKTAVEDTATLNDVHRELKTLNANNEKQNQKTKNENAKKD